MQGECVTGSTHFVWAVSEGRDSLSEAEGRAHTVAQQRETAWLIPGTREGQHLRADRAWRQVERDMSGLVNRDQTPQGCEDPVEHVGLYPPPLKKDAGRFLEVMQPMNKALKVGDNCNRQK